MILEKINADLIATMKDREPARKEANQIKILTLRTLLSEVKTFQVNHRRDPLDEEVAAILHKGIKQIKETLEKAQGQNQAGVVRADIVAQESAKLNLYQGYLPAQMERMEIEALVRAAITEVKAQSIKDMGAVMAVVRPKTQGRADGKLVSDIVRASLAV